MQHKTLTYILNLTLIALCFSLSACTNNVKNNDAMNEFINKMVSIHQFDPIEMHELFKSIEIKDDILKRISSPSENMPWYSYRKIFVTDERINSGVKFWQQNESTLSTVAKQSGVPAEIIVAIIGVETLYGQKTGNHRVIDALATLAFAYPPRSTYFLNELEDFLLLCREEKLNPLAMKGSYAGAMGIPQFMPSSFRNIAVDFEYDGHKDILHNPNDAIASIANYFIKHQWKTGQPIAIPVSFKGENNQKITLSSGLKPDLSQDELELLNLKTMRPTPSLTTKVKLLSFEQPLGQKQTNELWAGLDNFYVITRYNHSPLYAMAVYQLSQSILNKKGNFP
jgi:membrane-bound lytic murein transglycosylase B